MLCFTYILLLCCVVCWRQVILSSEAEKQAAINRANGEAQAITARAQVGAVGVGDRRMDVCEGQGACGDSTGVRVGGCCHKPAQ